MAIVYSTQTQAFKLFQQKIEIYEGKTKEVIAYILFA
jgi:hypothetical protein